MKGIGLGKTEQNQKTKTKQIFKTNQIEYLLLVYCD